MQTLLPLLAIALGFVGSSVTASGLLDGDDRARSVVYIECEDSATARTVGQGADHVHLTTRRVGTGLVIDEKGTVLTARDLVPGRLDPATGRMDYRTTRCFGTRGSAANIPVRRLINPNPVGNLHAITLSFVPDPGEVFRPFEYVPIDELSTSDGLVATGFRAGNFGMTEARDTIASVVRNADQTVPTDREAGKLMSGSPVLLETTKELVGMVVATDTDTAGQATQWGVLGADTIAEVLRSLRRSQLTGEATVTVRREDVPDDRKTPVVASLIDAAPIRALAPGDDKSETFVPHSVIGDDERTAVPDTREFPASAIATVLFHSPDDASGSIASFQCTGVLVSPDTVLTAAHCIVNRTGGVAYEGFRVLPGRNVGALPFGECGVVRTFVMPQFLDATDDSWRGYNLGALRLDCEVGLNTGWFGLLSAADSDLSSLVWAGYIADRSPPGRQWVAPLSGAGIEDLVLRYDTFTGAGSSGSPIFDPSGDQLVAIHAFGPTTDAPFRSGPLITPSRIRTIQSWIAADRGPVPAGSLLHIACSDAETGRFAEGSGLVVSPEGHVLTAGAVAGGGVTCTGAIGDSLGPRRALSVVAPVASGRLMLMRLDDPAGAQAMALPRESGPELGSDATVAAFLPGEFGPYSERAGVVQAVAAGYFTIDIPDPALRGGVVADRDGRLLGVVFGTQRRTDGTISTLATDAATLATELDTLFPTTP